MITIPEVVERLVKQSPLLEEGLSLGIINLSSLARQLQPQIKQELLKDIQTGAIIMALKRLSVKLQTHPVLRVPSISITDLTVRSNLAEFTFQNSPTLLEKQEKLLKLAGKKQSSFLTFTYGLFETTLIISSSLEKEVTQVLKEERLISSFNSLSAITLILPKATLYQSGIYYQILKRLFLEGINVVEIICSLREFTIILEKTEVDKAFSILKDLS